MRGNHSATSKYGKGREQRRVEAEYRQAARNKLSVEEHLSVLNARPGESLRERRRLAAQEEPNHG